MGAFDYTNQWGNNACLLMHDSLGSWGVDSEAWVTKHDKTAHDRVCG